MRVLISVLFLLCLCVVAFGQREPPTTQGKITLVGNLAPSTFQDGRTTFLVDTVVSFTNTSSDTKQSIQPGDSFSFLFDPRLVLFITVDELSAVIVNSNSLQAQNFKASVASFNKTLTVTYTGQPAFFSPADTVSVKVKLLTYVLEIREKILSCQTSNRG